MIETKLNRRSLIKLAGGTGLALSVAGMPRLARAQVRNDQVVLLVFLRGGADGMSFLHPSPGTSPARKKYEAWRGPGTRVVDGIPIGDGFAMHPALAPLQSLLPRGELTFVPGLGGAQFNRSHFEQQDLIESGAGGAQPPRPDGFLGRALELMPQRTETLAAVSLNALTPYSLKFAGRPALSVPSFDSFGALGVRGRRANPNRGFRDRLQSLFVAPIASCDDNVFCQSGEAAVSGIDRITALRSEVPSFPSDQMAGLAAMLRADDTNLFKFMTLDVEGWDTHNGQGNDETSSGAFAGSLASNIDRLAKRLRSLYDAAKTEGVWDRCTVVVISEFGRTTKQNGTLGTDHGFGSCALVLGNGLRQRIVDKGYFPTNTSAPFYSSAEGQNVVPRLLEHRQVLGQVLRDRVGLTAAQIGGSVFPGFTFDSSVPRLFEA